MTQKFGDFRLHGKLGTGGMADVYVATHPGNASPMAIKILRHPMIQDAHDRSALNTTDLHQQVLEMFLTEADIGRMFKHRNVVRVGEGGFVSGQPYMLMEWVRGTDLEQLLDRHNAPLPEALCIYIMGELLAGLNHLHTASTPTGIALQMVHRDISPGNLFVSVMGDIKIGDFGVAHVSFLEDDAERFIVKGKPRYLPPDALDGELCQQRDDLWALAITTLEMLQGTRLLTSMSVEQLQTGRPAQALRAVLKDDTDISVPMKAVLLRMLHKKPQERFPSAGAALKAVQPLLQIHAAQDCPLQLACLVKQWATVLPEPHPKKPTTTVRPSLRPERAY